MREYEKSIADGRRAAALDPANPDVHLELGRALHQLRRFREAIAEYDEAIRLVPRGDVRVGVYYHNRSYAWAGMGERGKALEDAREAQRRGAQVDSRYLHEIGG
jgi:tetratricopeptide (TPR) repeat protein